MKISKMINLKKVLFSVFCQFLVALLLVFLSFDLEVNAENIKPDDKLIEKIAKDFSSKFCNGVGFGLSQESAFNFAMKENMAIFKNKKGIENVNGLAISEKVSSLVVEKCGYPLEISEGEWGQTFRRNDLN